MPPSEDNWSIKKLLDWTKAYFQRLGLESPALEAEILLAHVLNYQRYQLYMNYEENVGNDPRSRYRELVKLRSTGMPVAYLVERKEFYSLPFTLTRAVLIPRPDTETLVDACRDALRGRPAPRLVDVGTGSGNVALACARWLPDSQIIAVDVSPEALDVARKNAKQLKLESQIEFRQGSLLEPVADEPPFDAVISNPPYIPTDDLAALEPSVRDFEPRHALDGGPDGLQWIRPLIAQAHSLLKPGGHLLLEIGFDQEAAVHRCLEDASLWLLAPTRKDHAGHPRIIHAQRRDPAGEAAAEAEKAKQALSEPAIDAESSSEG